MMKKSETINDYSLATFVKTIWDFYAIHRRSFSWRHVDDPYKITISEIMLQQTQTNRVIEKYDAFIARFPSFQSLSNATLRDVLISWQGLGYNRRGKYVYEIAQKIMSEYHGLLPNDPKVLINFPGIGSATASSICAFAFNMPTVFIETNIRTVFIHHFFKGKTNIKDNEIMPLIQKTVDKNRARDWYYALMDYGVMLKKNSNNPSRKSAHHTKQSPFEGSDRQMRGMILKLLTQFPNLSFQEIVTMTQKDSQKIEKILFDLCSENLISRTENFFYISLC